MCVCVCLHNLQGPLQNENVDPLVQKFLRILRRQQLSIQAKDQAGNLLYSLSDYSRTNTKLARVLSPRNSNQIIY